MFKSIKVLVFCFLFSGVIFAQEDPSRELLQKARKGQINLSILEDLVRNGADVNAKEEKTGVTVLMYVASHGVLKVDVMKRLIELGADVNAQDIDGRTPIMYSGMNYLARYQSPLSNNLMLFNIARPEFKDIYILVEAGADLKVKDNEGRTVLDRVKEHVTLPPIVVWNRYLAGSGFEMGVIEATQPKMIKFLEKLISANNSTGVVPGQNVITDSDIEKASIMLLNKIKNREFAVMSGIENLVSRGADVNYADENGVTVLMHAASHGFDALGVMKLLVSNGANVNAQDKMGQTPIMYAATNYLSRFQSLRSIWYDMIGIKKPEVADLYFLFKSGADLNIRDSEGRTVIERVRAGVVQPTHLFSSNLGHEIVSFQDGQPKVLKVLEGYAENNNLNKLEAEGFTVIDNLEENTVSPVENNKTKDPIYDVDLEKYVDDKLEEVRREAWAQRDKGMRDMMDQISYGEKGVSVTNGEAIDSFLERLLMNLSSDKSYEFNIAVALLLNSEVIDFMERYALSRTSGDLTYGLMMTAIKDCRNFIKANEINFASNPALVEVKNQKIREMNKSVARYRGK